MIRFAIAGGTFTLRPWPTAITLVMLIALLGLGTWQVRRLHWKENLIAEIDAHMHEAPVDVHSISSFRGAQSANPESSLVLSSEKKENRIPDRPDVASGMTILENMEYRPITAGGLFQHDKEFYLGAISLKGEGGYHVLTPMQLDDGRYLLVDRGWVPYDRGRGSGVGDQKGDFFRPIGPVTVKGLLRLPHPGWMQPANDAAKNNWYGVDFAAMAKTAAIPAFLPFVLEVDATPNPGGYPVGGQTRVELPNNHLSYAITWYGLALALMIIYIVSGYRRPQ